MTRRSRRQREVGLKSEIKTAYAPVSTEITDIFVSKGRKFIFSWNFYRFLKIEKSISTRKFNFYEIMDICTNRYNFSVDKFLFHGINHFLSYISF